MISGTEFFMLVKVNSGLHSDMKTMAKALRRSGFNLCVTVLPR